MAQKSGLVSLGSLTVLGWHVDNHRESVVDKRIERLVPIVYILMHTHAQLQSSTRMRICINALMD